MPCEECCIRSSFCSKRASFPAIGDLGLHINIFSRPKNNCDAFKRAPHELPIFWIILANDNKVRVFTKAGQLDEILVLTPAKSAPPYFAGTVFINDVLTWINEASISQCFDRIVMCAPSKTLSQIRENLPEALAKYVVAEIDKNLTKLDDLQLKEELSKIIWFI